MIMSVEAEARQGPATRHNRRDQEEEDSVEDDEVGIEMTPLNAPPAEDGVQDDHHPQLNKEKAAGVLSLSSNITSGGSRWQDLLPVCRDNVSRGNATTKTTTD